MGLHLLLEPVALLDNYYNSITDAEDYLRF